MEEHSESGERGRMRKKSESYANEVRERYREARISAATMVSVNITVTCRQWSHLINTDWKVSPEFSP